MNKKNKTSLLARPGVQSVIAAVICVLLGLFIGFLVLLAINPAHAWEAIVSIVKNFMTYPSHPARMKYLGNTLVKMAPLLMCALSVQFCYKVGLFNIGAAGQYVAGAGAAIYCALALNLPWYVCVIAAMLAGMLLGAITGMLKAYLNVNEVISGIMLNWIGLYTVNMLLNGVKETTSPYTLPIASNNPSAIIPSMGLSGFFANNKYVTIAIPLSVIIAIVIWVVQTKTKLGYELQATGYNKEAARYAGMREKRNTILTLIIGGALAGMGAAFLYLTGYEQWGVTQSSVPAMGFNGIAATFLGGLNPIGTIFSSYFIQHITSGGSYVDKAIYSSQVSDLITAIIIYLCGFVLFMKLVMSGYAAKKNSADAPNSNAVDETEKNEGKEADKA